MLRIMFKNSQYNVNTKGYRPECDLWTCLKPIFHEAFPLVCIGN